LRRLPHSDKGVLTPLSSPKNFFTKNLVKLAAQTRYGVIKSAPLYEKCKQYHLSLMPTAAKAADSTDTAFYLANLSANAAR